jgi:hypothetical protein
MSKVITYGIGGYDETKPDNNIIEIVEVDEDAPVLVGEPDNGTE